MEEGRESIAARQGALLLDALKPGWADELDVSDMIITSPGKCPLRQLYGSYEGGQQAILSPALTGDLDQYVALNVICSALGFDIGLDRGHDPEKLQHAWLREIEDRRHFGGRQWGPLDGLRCAMHDLPATECIAEPLMKPDPDWNMLPGWDMLP